MSMKRPRFNLGRVEWIGAEAVGVPGQRTFRLLLQTDSRAAQLWLEKEQLQALTDAIARMLIEIDADSGTDYRPMGSQSQTNPKPPGFPEQAEIEFQIGALGLRYDRQRDLVAVEAFERGADEDDDPPTLRCLTTRRQMETLQANSLEVISAGRPRCPLCGTPLASTGLPHFCPPD